MLELLASELLNTLYVVVERKLHGPDQIKSVAIGLFEKL